MASPTRKHANKSSGLISKNEMAKNKNTDQYQKGMLDELLDRIAKYYEADPTYLKALIRKRYPQFADKTRCPNCRASMAVYVYTIDYLTASLLLEMGAVVRDRVRKGVLFPDANKVHVQSDLKGSYAVKSRTTIASKLGLITKVMKIEGKDKKVHDTKAGWLITKRGYNFLRGEYVTRSVKVFRNEIQERDDDLITIEDALKTGPQITKELYRKEDWVTVDSYMQGVMF